jgi:hypothetical protein
MNQKKIKVMKFKVNGLNSLYENFIYFSVGKNSRILRLKKTLLECKNGVASVMFFHLHLCLLNKGIDAFVKGGLTGLHLFIFYDMS